MPDTYRARTLGESTAARGQVSEPAPCSVPTSGTSPLMILVTTLLSLVITEGLFTLAGYPIPSFELLGIGLGQFLWRIFANRK